MTAGGVAGIDIGGTKVLGVLLDRGGTVVREHRVATPRGRGPLVAAVAEVLDALGPVGAVGVGAAGLVTAEGVLRMGPNLPGTREWPVAADVVGLVGPGVPVAVANDATCATLAEWRLGAGRGVDDVALITLGTGMGGGFVVGGRLVLGRNGFAGEPGHMVVVPDGVPCVCGARGCWERYASGAALARYGAEAGLLAGDGGPLRGEDVSRAAAAGDPRAETAFAELAWWTALGIVNLVNLLDPAVVVVGGGLVVEADRFLPAVRDHVPALLYGPGHRPVPEIVAADLGARAAALGAALLAAQHTEAPGPLS